MDHLQMDYNKFQLHSNHRIQYLSFYIFLLSGNWLQSNWIFSISFSWSDISNTSLSIDFLIVFSPWLKKIIRWSPRPLSITIVYSFFLRIKDLCIIQRHLQFFDSIFKWYVSIAPIRHRYFWFKSSSLLFLNCIPNYLYW
jgi:hypothetical protein